MTLDAVEAVRAIADATAGGPAVAVVTVVAGPVGTGARLLAVDDGRTRGTLGNADLDAAAIGLARQALARGAGVGLEVVHTAAGGFELFVEAHRARERLLIVGAGHIAVPLAAYGAALGFDVTVLDDREAFATGERFADGVRVLQADFEADPFAGQRIDGRTYVALVTRGHRWDFDCLRRLVHAAPPPRYIGMIGSRRRVRAAFHALLEAGVPRETLARVRAPIGLELGAETPEEIAVSIAAELIAERRGVDVDSMARRERVLDRAFPEKADSDG
jgi:xanthine dehydrogenase accessory factor